MKISDINKNGTKEQKKALKLFRRAFQMLRLAKQSHVWAEVNHPEKIEEYESRVKNWEEGFIECQNNFKKVLNIDDSEVEKIKLRFR